MQVESTVAIQALQPRVKEIQEKYKGRDPQEAQVWPLCHREELLEVLDMCLQTWVLQEDIAEKLPDGRAEDEIAVAGMAYPPSSHS